MTGLVQKASAAIRSFVESNIFAKIDCRLDCKQPSEGFGSVYGGWDLITDGLGRDSIVYSFGVGEDASFDIALIERFGLKVHAFDPTPKSIAWAKRQSFSPSFVLHEYGICDYDGTISFNPPEDPDHVSHTILARPTTAQSAITVPVKRLSTIMTELGHDHLDVLKMDVEGAEYGIIDDIERMGIRPRQFLIEFHHRFENVGIGATKKAIATIRRMGYRLYSASAAQELCFIRKM